MKNVLILLAFAAPMAFSWGNMETTETRSYPGYPVLDLDFTDASVDLSFYNGEELRITNNEYTDPDFPLSVAEGRVSFDAATYRETHETGSGSGEKPKYRVRIPATTERIAVRADRVRLRPELIAQSRPIALRELAIAGTSIELRDIDPLPFSRNAAPRAGSNSCPCSSEGCARPESGPAFSEDTDNPVAHDFSIAPGPY